MTSYSPFKTTTFSEKNYTFKVKINKHSTYIFIEFKTTYFHTCLLPQTISMLDSYLPSIFKCTCYNDGHKSFREEAADTELGHLFEHIILEYLCAFKIKNGAMDAVYNGETKWNWNEDPQGTFHIYIDSGLEEAYVFYNALRKASWLLNKIISQPTNEVQLNK